MSRIRADQLVNRAGSGGPKFPNGVAEGFSVSGVVTATSFTGNLTGNADTATTATTATNAQGLTGTPNITVGTIGCGNVTSTGDVTAVDGTFSGNLTVQGTTTTIDTAVIALDSLQIDGNVAIGTITAGRHLTVSGGASEGAIQITNNTSGHTAANGFELIHFTSGETQFLNRENGAMRFDTNGTERLRIDSNGKTGININNPGSYNSAGNELVLGNTSNNGGMTIVSGTGNNGHIFFADGTASGAQNRGIIKYEHANDAMAFNTAESERLRIGSTGEIGLGGANYGTAGQVLTSQGSGSPAQWASPGGSISAGARYTNPNTTSVEWTSLPANIQALEIGYASAYAGTNNAENERLVLRLGTSGGYVTSNYNNYSWNQYGGGNGHGFSATKSAFIPYYWIDATDRATAMFTLRRMGTSNTFQAQWHEYISGGHNYVAMGGGYVDLGAELTQVRFQTINNNSSINGSYWINYTTR